MAQTIPHLIGAAEACSRLGGIDRSTLSRWVAAGRIAPAIKAPGARGAFLVHPSEVDRLASDLAKPAEVSA